MSWKNAPKLDFETMKYWWFLNTSGEFKVRRKLLVFGLNNYPIPPKQMYKKKKTRTCFCNFQERSSCVDTQPTNVRHIWSGRQVVQFLWILWKTKVDLGKKNYTTFINSSGVIFERNMRVVNFWTMCHHSLGHEKKPLLTISANVL